jgi:excisionase family DNA binding protein
MVEPGDSLDAVCGDAQTTGAVLVANGDLHIVVPDELLDEITARVAQRLAAPECEPWVGVERAAGHLGCPRQRIYHLTAARAIPFRKDGTRLLFRLSELDAWLNDQT